MELNDQNPVITSKYEPKIVLKLALIYGFVLFLAIKLLIVFNVISLVVMPLIMFGVWYFEIMAYIIVSSENIKIRYLNGKLETIDYYDIKSISSKRVVDRSFGVDRFGPKRQQIELRDGQIIEFNKKEFSNYDELEYYISYYRSVAISKDDFIEI